MKKKNMNYIIKDVKKNGTQIYNCFPDKKDEEYFNNHLIGCTTVELTFEDIDSIKYKILMTEFYNL